MSQFGNSTFYQSNFSMQEILSMEQVGKVVENEATFMMGVLSRARMKLGQLTNNRFRDFVLLRIKFSIEVDRYTATTYESNQLQLINLDRYFHASSSQQNPWMPMNTQWQNMVTPGELITTIVWRARQVLFFMGVGQFQSWSCKSIEGAIKMAEQINDRNLRNSQSKRKILPNQPFSSSQAQVYQLKYQSPTGYQANITVQQDTVSRSLGQVARRLDFGQKNEIPIKSSRQEYRKIPSDSSGPQNIYISERQHKDTQTPYHSLDYHISPLQKNPKPSFDQSSKKTKFSLKNQEIPTKALLQHAFRLLNRELNSFGKSLLFPTEQEDVKTMILVGCRKNGEIFGSSFAFQMEQLSQTFSKHVYRATYPLNQPCLRNDQLKNVSFEVFFLTKRYETDDYHNWILGLHIISFIFQNQDGSMSASIQMPSFDAKKKDELLIGLLRSAGIEPKGGLKQFFKKEGLHVFEFRRQSMSHEEFTTLGR